MGKGKVGLSGLTRHAAHPPLVGLVQGADQNPLAAVAEREEVGALHLRAAAAARSVTSERGACAAEAAVLLASSAGRRQFIHCHTHRGLRQEGMRTMFAEVF